jgi:hypothetical protein
MAMLVHLRDLCTTLTVQEGKSSKSEPEESQNSTRIHLSSTPRPLWKSCPACLARIFLMKARGIIDRLPHLELDSIMAEDGVPLIEECEELWCDIRTLAIWGATAFGLMLVSLCLCWNCYIHWRADNATDVPAFLQNIREQQAKYKQMHLKVPSSNYALRHPRTWMHLESEICGDSPWTCVVCSWVNYSFPTTNDSACLGFLL